MLIITVGFAKSRFDERKRFPHLYPFFCKDLSWQFSNHNIQPLRYLRANICWSYKITQACFVKKANSRYYHMFDYFHSCQVFHTSVNFLNSSVPHIYKSYFRKSTRGSCLLGRQISFFLKGHKIKPLLKFSTILFKLKLIHIYKIPDP